MQISFTVTAKLIRVFVFATLIAQSLYFLNTYFKPLAILCGCTARFLSDLVGNPEDRFSHNEACMSAELLTRQDSNQPAQLQKPASAVP